MDYLYETHMHTAEISACAVSGAEEQIRAYKSRGYAGVIITDHFINGNSTIPKLMRWKKQMDMFVSGYQKAKAEGDRIGLDVFFGWEYSILGSDFLTYGLAPDFLYAQPGLDKLPIEAYSALVRASGGFIVQAHPFREAWYIAIQHPAEPALLDGVEVFNASMPPDVNAKALAFAEQNGLPMQAGSDSHNIELRFPSGVALDKKAEGLSDIIAAVKTGTARMILP
ncbi:MAG: PHP domain-containing protein [Oscillospiraceae bacterium]|nr:PHP domain-containing protein [Oscillospiraceae bacterium]